MDYTDQNWVAVCLSNNHGMSFIPNTSDFSFSKPFRITRTTAASEEAHRGRSRDVSGLMTTRGQSVDDLKKSSPSNDSVGKPVCFHKEASATALLYGEQSGVVKEPRTNLYPAVPAAKRAANDLGQRTSIYRGVTKHRWTGRYEAHLWDNSSRREGQSRKGRQVYLGGYDREENAARAYDLAALKYWGPTTTTNFPVSNYEKEEEEMKHMSRQLFVAALRRKSSGFSRGASIYRGVTRHHQHGRWQARIGRVAGNKDLYLGTFSTQEEAAEAYDIAAIKFRGLGAVTNFDMSRYDVQSIASTNLPIGGISSSKSATYPCASDEKSTINESQWSNTHLSSISSSISPSHSWSFLGCENNAIGSYGAFLSNGGGFEERSGSGRHVWKMNGGVANGTSSQIPFSGSRNNNYEGDYGNRITQYTHYYQSADSDLSMFQTPIIVQNELTSNESR